jgi:uncharacterized RDD family membrane protein YckC
MSWHVPQVSILRMAAWILDLLCIALGLILPTSLISYAVAWSVGATKWVTLVWYGALLIVIVGALLRDSYRGGRSPGKRILGLRLVTASGRPCNALRSIVRNIPLLVPGWNFIELVLVLRGGDRTGDRMAGTSVSEE